MRNYYDIIDHLLKLDEKEPSVIWYTCQLLENLQLEIDTMYKSSKPHDFNQACIEECTRQIIHEKIERRIRIMQEKYLNLYK